MKRILQFLFLLTICFSAHSQAGLFTGKYSANQVFDVQRNGCYSVGGSCSVSNMIAPFIAPYTNWTHVNFAAGDYVMFYNNGAASNYVGMKQYASDGTYKSIISSSGYVMAIGSGIVYIGVPDIGGGTGYFISNDAGYALGSSTNVTVQYVNPTLDQLNSYQASTTPLAAGQTAQPTAPAAPAFDGTLTQTNNPSNQTIGSGSSYVAPTDASTKQVRVNTWNNGSQNYNNELYIDQTGFNNTINITQSGNKNKIDFTMNGNNNLVNTSQTGSNYLKMDVPGWGNNITTTQSNTITSNYAETKIQGNGNTVNHTQTGNAQQVLFSKITGDINTVNTTQSGAGAHVADVTLTGNFNSAIIDQSGSTANKANINLTNNGGAASVDLQQSGGKSFTLIQGCANPAGCSTVVRQ